MIYYTGTAITYTCAPVTPGYVVGDHTVLWTFHDATTSSSLTLPKTWAAPGIYTEVVVATNTITNVTASANVVVTFIVFTQTAKTNSGAKLWRGVASSSDGVKLASADSLPGYIWASTDSGNTWVQQTGSGSRGWQNVFSSKNGTKLVGVVYSGLIYYSLDSGSTWATATGPVSSGWWGLVCSDDGTKWISGALNGGVWRSVDSGATWVQLAGGLPSEFNQTWYGFASSADGTILYGAKAGGSTGSKVYVSTDSGATWITSGVVAPGGIYEICCSSDGSIVYVTDGYNHTGYIYKSSNYGASWAQLTAAGLSDWRGICCSSNGRYVIACGYAGYIGMSEDFGVTWTARGGVKNWLNVICSDDGARITYVISGDNIWTSP
jgi:hypothetical protein